MTIKVIIRRKFKEGHLKEANSMLIKARHNAMQTPGYLSSETLSGCDDPNEILVLSMWRKKEDWDQYESSSVRQGLEQQFAEVMDGPSQAIAYVMGLSS